MFKREKARLMLTFNPFLRWLVFKKRNFLLFLFFLWSFPIIIFFWTTHASSFFVLREAMVVVWFYFYHFLSLNYEITCERPNARTTLLRRQRRRVPFSLQLLSLPLIPFNSCSSHTRPFSLPWAATGDNSTLTVTITRLFFFFFSFL